MADKLRGNALLWHPFSADHAVGVRIKRIAIFCVWYRGNGCGKCQDEAHNGKGVHTERAARTQSIAAMRQNRILRADGSASRPYLYVPLQLNHPVRS